MTDRLPTPEIPSAFWEQVTSVDYRSKDIEETMGSMLGADAFPLVMMLGSSGINLATQIRLHDFEELTDNFGMPINEKKQNPLWLATEAQCIKENLEAQQ
jgi:hypothetical protein